MDPEQPQPQPQPAPHSLLRDIFVQAVGSAVGVGLVALVASAYGFIDLRLPDDWVRTTAGLLLLAVAMVNFIVMWVSEDFRGGVPSSFQPRYAWMQTRRYRRISLPITVGLAVAGWFLAGSPPPF